MKKFKLLSILVLSMIFPSVFFSSVIAQVNKHIPGITKIVRPLKRETVNAINNRAKTFPDVRMIQLEEEEEEEGPDRSHLRQNPLSKPISTFPERNINSVNNRTQTTSVIQPPQTIGLSFNGVTGPTETGAVVPDNMGAIGPAQYIMFINGRLRSFNKTTGVADGVLNVNPDAFFASVMTTPGAGERTYTADPRIRYDRLSGKWILVMMDVTRNNTTNALTRANRILIAFSNNATITGSTTWTFSQFTAQASRFADYPTLGIDANALYVGTNMFTFSSQFSGTNGYVINRTALLSGGAYSVTAFLGLGSITTFDGPYTPQGVDNFDVSATEGYFIGVDLGTYGTLTLRRVSDPGGSPTISGNIFLTVPTTVIPRTVPHLGNTGGSDGNLDAVGDRLFAATIRNGHLWTSHNIGVDETGVASGSNTRNGVRWYDITNLASTPSLNQSGTIFDNNTTVTSARDYFIPSVMISGQGHAVFSLTTAGTSFYSNAAIAGRLSNDGLGTTQTPVLTTASSTSYNPLGDPGTNRGARRWGDYSYVSVDPLDDMTMWMINQYCVGTDVYGCNITKIMAPPPATPTSCSPASVVVGQASVDVIVTGVIDNGSGFFDPGANLSAPALPFNHIAASVSGGIVVNSIAYTDPTHVTLNLNTTASTSATHTITITNPDGQSLTSGFILTSACAVFSNNRAYVSASATGANNGTTWADAFTSLQSALAITGNCGIAEIWVAAGTYKPTTTTDRSISFVMKNNLAIYGGFAGTETVLSERDWITNISILSGDIGVAGNTDNSYNVVKNLDNGLNSTAILDGFTITNGNANGGYIVPTSPLNCGGGMYNSQSSPTISHCTFNGNSASGSSGTGGGGMFNYNSASPIISNCSFIGNSATTGGGGLHNNLSCSPTLTNCVFTGNTTAGSGGAINNYSSSNPVISNSRFSGNSASISGGGLYNNFATLNLTNCIFNGNNGGGNGGAIFQNNASLTLMNSSFSGNVATSGAALKTTASLGLQPASNIVNSIFWGDVGTEIVTANTGFGNAVTDVTYSIVQGGLPGTGNLNLDPLFGSASDLNLQPGSPAINAGTNTGAPTTDLDGNTRPLTVANPADMGAYEFQIVCPPANIVYVNTNATGANNGTSWTDAFTKLQDALALSCPNVTQIWVAKGNYYPDEGGGQPNNDVNATFTLKNSVAIYGGFAGTETTLSDRDWRTNVTILSGDIDGDNTIANNAYHVTTGSGTNSTAILDGFTVTGGNAICTGTCGVGGQWGGGMLNSSGSPTVSNCIFMSNIAAQFGGGMANINSSPIITSCIFLGNSYSLVVSEPHAGGGMFNQGSSPRVVNCIFSGNSAGSAGGGMYNTTTRLFGQPAIISAPIITNCTFSGNSAFFNSSGSSAGGGLANASGSSATLSNSIFWNNRDNSGTGTATASINGTASVSYSLVQGQSPVGTGNLDGTNAANNPLFVTPVDPTTAPAIAGDLHLQAGSPAINAGTNTGAPSTDIEGTSRPLTVANPADMGAYESLFAPVITSGAATGTISTCAGSASASPNIQQFTVSGTGLTANITVNAPTNFEVSTSAGSGYSSSLTLTQTAGSLPNTMIYVRSSASAPVGPISGNVGLISAGANTANVAVSGTINPIPATPTITPNGPTSFCNGSSVTLTSSSAAGNQWYLNGNPIGGATNPSYNATASGNYTDIVSSLSCSSAASLVTTVTVNPVPSTPTVTPDGPTTFCAGGSVTLTSSSAAGNQWYSNGNPIGSATNQTYVATASGNYTVIVTSLGCSSAASAGTSVTVNPIPATPTITPNGPTTFCSGSSVTLTSSSAAGNQWYLNGNPIGSATNQTYVATASGNYTVIVSSLGCSSAASAGTSVTVNPIPTTPTITPNGPTTFCNGSSVTLSSSSATGNQWYLNGNPIGSATNQTYVATASGNYTVIVTSLGCSSTPSTGITVTVNPIPTTPTVTPNGPTTFCSGSSVTLTSSSAIGNEWYLNGNPIGSAINQTYVATASGNYTVIVTSLGCSSTPSTGITVTVNPIPATPTVTPNGPTTFCNGSSVTLTSSSATGNQWYLNGNPIGSAINQTYVATASGNYTVIVTSLGCSSSPSTGITVTVTQIPTTPTITPGGLTTFCAGGSVTLTSSSATANQWYLNGNRIGSATNQTYVATVSGNYTVIVTSLNCSYAASAGTPVTVNPTPSATANPSSQTICSANTITTIALSGNVSGTTYNWTRNNTVSVTGIAANGSGNISGALTNTTNAPVTVTFTITPTANGCAGTAITATVLVNPKALVNAVPNQVVCNNTSTTAVSFSSPTTGGTIVYNWTNNTASIGLATSGSGNISAFTATNTTAAPITATITVTPSFTNGVTCIGTPITFTITVRPSIQSCNITPVPSNNVYTGGVPTNIYLGYGPQSVKLSTSAIGGNPFTYSWTGNGTLSCTNCAAPVFTPSAAGTYNFVVTITNSFGCKKTCRITICVLDIRVPGTNGAYVYICHYSNGKPPTQTIQVGINAVPTHIYSPGHGDRLGKCNDVPCGSNARYVNAIETKGPEQIIYNDFKMLVSPNPLSSSATIHYVLPENAHISLGVYNQLGQKVKQLAEGNMIAGNHYQKFDATKLAAGIYFCHLLTITADGKLIELNEKLVVAK